MQVCAGPESPRSLQTTGAAEPHVGERGRVPFILACPCVFYERGLTRVNGCGRLHSFSVGIEGSPDIKAAAEVGRPITFFQL
jgi:hypothetical protein